MFDVNNYLVEITAETRRDRCIANYLAKKPYIFPQLGLEGGLNKTTRKNLEKQTRVDVRWLDRHIIKRSIEPWRSITTWVIATIMFDGILPIGIIRNTANMDDRYNNFLAINYEQHTLAARYLFDFIEADFGPSTELSNTIGSFSGDVQPNFSSNFSFYYDLNNLSHIDKLNVILDYTVN